jgi:beta-lactamase regulating signal transducer with metallopeptidase domain
LLERINHSFALPAFAFPAEAVRAVTTTASPSPVSAVLFSIWLCGFAVSAAVWLQLWRRFRVALRAASPLPWDLPIPVMTSPGRMEPGVFGILKPILLLPEGILNRLTPEQLNAILAHELCHVRRRDNLTAAIHMLVESVFWFHPLAWWIGNRMVAEREQACDEEVVRLGNEPGVYAEGILNVCTFCVRSPLPCASGVTGADLRKRIESIMTYRTPHRLTLGRKLLLAGAGLVVVASPVLAGILNVSQSRKQSKAERLDFGVAPGGPLLRAQVAPAQATKPRKPASSFTQRDPFEAIPEPPPEPSLPKVSGPPIGAIEFLGATHVSLFALRAIIASRVGDAYDTESLRRDSQYLYNTGRFSQVRQELEPGPNGATVRFVLVERPVIQSIKYQGDDTVTVVEILERFQQRRIALRAETLYNDDDLARAAGAVQEVVAERGGQNITVTPLVETIQPSSPLSLSAVKITFRAEKKQ